MTKNSNNLLKLLGVSFGIAVTVGGTLGTGILRKPGPIAELIGDPVLIMTLWLLVGIYAFLGVLCVIELAVSLPKAGSWYVYARRAFGDYFGFITGITSWLGTVAALGFGAYTMGEYLAILFPFLSNFEQLTSTLLILLLMLFHWTGTKSAGKSQEILALIKAVGLLIFVAACFLYRPQESIAVANELKSPDNLSGSAGIVGIIAALQAIFYTYDGWHTASYFSEENTDPAKTLPKSMILGVLGIIVIYLLVNGAILYVLPMDQLAGSKLAAADAVKLIFGEGSSRIVTAFLLISILGIVNAQIMFAPRVIYSMGRDGLFLKSLITVNKWGTPAVAMPLTGMLSIALIMSGKNTCGILSDIATFFFVLSYSAGFAALIRLRYKEPDLPRPYKAPLFPYIPLLMVLVSMLFLTGAVYSDLNSSKFALIFILISFPLYKIVSALNRKKHNV